LILRATGERCAQVPRRHAYSKAYDARVQYSLIIESGNKTMAYHRPDVPQLYILPFRYSQILK